MLCSKNFGFLLQVFGGPGGLRKVREPGRNNFCQVLSKSDLTVPSYDEKTLSWVVDVALKTGSQEISRVNSLLTRF